MMFNFCPLAQLADTEPGTFCVFDFSCLTTFTHTHTQKKIIYTGTMVDVIGVVCSDGGVASLTTKSGRDCVKRDLEIVDDSQHSIRVTLWGERAEKELARYDQAPVIAFKGVKLGDYGGRSIGTYGSSTIVANPEVPETMKLRMWYDNGGQSASVTSLSSSGGGGGGFRSEVQPVSDIVDLNLGHGEKSDYIDVIAMCAHIRKDRASWYCACPNQRDGRQCNKKVLPMGTFSVGAYCITPNLHHERHY